MSHCFPKVSVAFELPCHMVTIYLSPQIFHSSIIEVHLHLNAFHQGCSPPSQQLKLYHRVKANILNIVFFMKYLLVFGLKTFFNFLTIRSTFTFFWHFLWKRQRAGRDVTSCQNTWLQDRTLTQGNSLGQCVQLCLWGREQGLQSV